MKVIQVCIGSACHLKGSYDVIQKFRNLIEEQGLDEQVELRSAFCLGECSQAVSVRLDQGPVCSVAPDTVETFFKCQVMDGDGQ